MSRLQPFDDLKRNAIFDPTGAYRYSLWRGWCCELPQVSFIMLNPSTADAQVDDATIRRCIGFAQSWQYGSLEAPQSSLLLV